MNNNNQMNQKLITDRSENSMNYYLDEIKNSTPLTRTEEKELGIKIQNGDDEAMQKLVEANLKYVVTLVKKYQTGQIAFTELLQQGNIGAIKAAKRFDPSKGNKFITYLKSWVKQSILQYVTEHYGKQLRLPANQYAIKSKIDRYKVQYIQENGYRPSVYDISEELDIEMDKVYFIENKLKSIVSMDNTLSDDTGTTLSETIEDVNSDNPCGLLMSESLSTDMGRVLNMLDYRERTIIKMYNGIGYNSEHSLDEIGYFFDLTRERIRQIKAEALKKMKKLIMDNNINYD